MMLAQVEQIPSDWLRNAMLFIAALAATAYYIKALFWGDKSTVPDPLRVQKVDRIVSEKECIARHTEAARELHEVRQKFNQLEASREVQRQQASEDRKIIYRHIDEVRRELSQKIDDMPDRVIATLKNTGAI